MSITFPIDKSDPKVMYEILQCKICGLRIKAIAAMGFHLKRHNISYKEYFDKYYLTPETKTTCVTCNNPTEFKGLVHGYASHCSVKCANNDPNINRKKKESPLPKIIKPENRLEILTPGPSIKRTGSIFIKLKDTSGIPLTIPDFPSQKTVQPVTLSISDTNSTLPKETKNIDIVKPKLEPNITSTKRDTILGSTHIISEEIQKKRNELLLTEEGRNKLKIIDTFGAKLLNKFKTHLANKFELIHAYLNMTFIDSEFTGRSKFHNWKCNICNTIINNKLNDMHQKSCPTCYPLEYNTFNMKMEVYEYVKSIGPKNLEISLDTKGFDVFVPEKNTAINLVKFKDSLEKIVGKHFHRIKTQECMDKGIRLIHIFEDEWVFNNKISKERLQRILGYFQHMTTVFGRKCIVKEIESSTKNKFLELYHIQGKDNSLVSLGLFQKDYNDMLAVMTFSKPNFSKGGKFNKGSDVWELNRFCVRHGYNVPGAAGKLLSYFKKTYTWSQIFSYADKRWSVGELYLKLGFTFDSDTQLNYWYISDEFWVNKIHRYSMRKSKEDDPEGMIELEIRDLQGLSRIWDSGSLKYVLINPNYVKHNNMLTI